MNTHNAHNCAVDAIIEKLRSTNENRPKSWITNYKKASSPCGICQQNVNKNQKSLLCTQCHHLIHIKCNGISVKEFKDKEHGVMPWICLSCTILNNSNIFPFTLETDNSLLGTNSSELPSLYDTLPSLDIVSKLTNLPNLSDYDIDENLDVRISSHYCTVEELRSKDITAKDLALPHMNIRSLPLHLDELLTLLEHLSIDFQVIGLSEIKDSLESPIVSNIEIPGYKFHHTPSKSACGGVGIYVKSDIKADKHDDLSLCCNEFETVWIEIEDSKTRNVLCCCAYRHPSSDISIFNDHIEDVISKLETENKLIYIVGDFNTDLLKYENHTLTSDFINMITTYQLQPLILHPKRVIDHSSALIDNIFSNNNFGNILGGSILTQITDHFPQFCIISDQAPEHNKCSHYAHDYRKFDQAKFLNEYVDLDFSFLETNDNNLNHRFDTFLASVCQLVNKHCPKKKINKNTLKLRNKPWITPRIQKMIRKQEKLLQQLKVTNSPEIYSLFKKFRNHVAVELKSEYFHRYFDQNRTNMKLLWKGIKSIIDLSASSANITLAKYPLISLLPCFQAGSRPEADDREGRSLQQGLGNPLNSDGGTRAGLKM